MGYNDEKPGIHFATFTMPKKSDMEVDKPWTSPLTGQRLYVLGFTPDKEAIVQIMTDNPYEYYGKQN
jgi:hypothetical protein